MKNLIPGHVRAFTWMLALTVGVVTLAVTGKLSATVGMLLVVTGAFLGDQATHLAQEDHAGTPPTWLERQQQRHRAVFVGLGLVLAGLGAWIAIR
jgi:hypothetical protein